MKEILPGTITYGLFALFSNLLVQNDAEAFTLSSSIIPSRSLVPSVPHLRCAQWQIRRAVKPWSGEDEYVGKYFDDDPKFSQDDDDGDEDSGDSLDKIDETRRLIEAQQKQIDLLEKRLTNVIQRVEGALSEGTEIGPAGEKPPHY